MPDLRTSGTMQQLIEHIVGKEGVVYYFYCDDRSPRGLVTIGIGHLVDRAGAGVAAGEALARDLFGETGVEFRHRDTNQLATEDQVVADWASVRAHGVAHPKANAAAYERVAQYRISEPVARLLLRQKVNSFIEELYARRPFAFDLAERIQAAIIDARYNAAGVGLYDVRDDPGDNFHPNIPRLWNALNPHSPHYDLDEALLIFEATWANRGVARYQQRHRQRVVMFWAGVEEMNRRSERRYRELIGDLARGRYR